MPTADAIRRPGRLWIALLLAAVTLAVYSPVRRFDFVSYDDPMNVTGNPHVQAGWTAESVRWALTTREDYWRPLTRLSHLADVEFFGMDAGAHHRTNLLLHAANTVLLFLLLAAWTGRPGRSVWVAAIFALHPLRIESVAWITERKDVLSGLFFLLTLHAWRRYTVRPAAGWYLFALALHGLGLTAKAMLLTLPGILLLLDVWPARRVSGWRSLRRLVLEKVPFAVLSLVCFVVIHAGQRHHGLAASAGDLPPVYRIANALAAYAGSLGKLLYPARLAILYPYPRTIPWGAAAGGLALLALGTALAIRSFRRRPAVFTGWFWFLLLLAPTTGLIQVGFQRMADRFTYLPSIGLGVAAAWGVMDLLDRRPRAARAAAAAGLLLVAACAWATARHLPVWRNSVALYEQAFAAGEGGFMLRNNLGLAYAAAGDKAKAAVQLEASLADFPHQTEARNNLAFLRLDAGRMAEGERLLRESLEIRSDQPLLRRHLALICLGQDRLEEAERWIRAELRRDSGDPLSRRTLAGILERLGRGAEALAEYEDALRRMPGPSGERFRLGVAAAAGGRYAEALALLRAGLAAEPEDMAALNALAWIRATAPEPALRDGAEAVRCAEKALRLAGGQPPPALLDTLAAAYAEAGRFEEAARTAARAERLAAERGDKAAAEEIGARRALYEQGRPYRSAEERGREGKRGVREES